MENLNYKFNTDLVYYVSQTHVFYNVDHFHYEDLTDLCHKISGLTWLRYLNAPNGANLATFRCYGTIWRSKILLQTGFLCRNSALF